MSKPIHLSRAGIAVAASCAFLALPAAAQAAAVDLGTASPFVVLGGQEVSNTGPSLLNGDLGVSPGTSLPGFQFATVNGTTHNNDAVAAQAQSDLTAAFDVAAAEPLNIGGDLSTQDLAGKTLLAGAYGFTSDAQLSGTVTFDAQNDPNAQFVVKVGSQLTTGSGSAVVLANGANPCNIYWKVDTAVLGSTTAFQGNVLALTSISLNNGASVIGRMLARNGTTSLINNTLNNSSCRSTSTPPGGTPPGGTPPGGTPPGGTTPGGTTPGTPTTPPGTGSSPGTGNQAPPESRTTVRTRNGSAILRRTPGGSCRDGFRARVRGKKIKRVVFSMDGKRISSRSKSPFAVFVRGSAGRHKVTARVTFTDATRAKTLKLGYRACSSALLQPRRGPSQFTG